MSSYALSTTVKHTETYPGKTNPYQVETTTISDKTTEDLTYDNGSSVDLAFTGTGSNAQNVMTGGAAADTLMGLGGNDTVIGGAGADKLEGGAGNDRYIFDRGSGRDVVYDDYRETVKRLNYPENLGGQWTSTTTQYDGGKDTLSYGGTLTISDLILTISGSDLIVGIREFDGAGAEIALANLSDKVTVTAWQNAKNKVEGLAFQGGFALDISGIAAFSSTLDADDNLAGIAGNDFLSSGAGNDTITANAGNDILVGGAGNDSLNAGAGSDTYLFNAGSGIDTINNQDNSSSTIDILRFLDATSTQGIWLGKAGDDLVVSVLGTGDRAVLAGYYTSAASKALQIDEIRIGGSTLVLHQTGIDQLVAAMASFTGTDGLASSGVQPGAVPQSVQLAVNGAWAAS